MNSAEIGFIVLRIIHYVSIWSEYIFEKSLQIYSAVASVFQDKAFVFFQKDGAAYAWSNVSVTASGSAKAEWAYDPDTYTFYEWCVNPTYSRDTANKKRCLPILSMELVEGQGDEATVFYDLTDFIEKVVVMNIEGGAMSFPSVAQIIGAWTLGSNIVADKSGRFKVRCVTEMADTIEMQVGNLRPIHTILEAMQNSPKAAAGGAGASAIADSGPKIE